MFDDDFESMQEAVCKAANTKVPKPKVPKPKSDEWLKETPPPQHDHDYVPPESPPKPKKKVAPTYDLSRHIMETMKSTVTKERLSKGQIEQFRRAIRLAIFEHGNIRVTEEMFPHMDTLYPREAAEAIVLSTTKHWPGIKLEDVLEGMMYEFLQDRTDIKEFVQKLGQAVRDGDIMEGIALRLNLQTIIKPESVDRITINTKFGSVTKAKIPRRTAFSGALREMMKDFLRQQGAFTPHINVVYQGLERADKQYNLEQKLLSWMGYLVVRSIAENAKQGKLNMGNVKLLGHSKEDRK